MSKGEEKKWGVSVWLKAWMVWGGAFGMFLEYIGDKSHLSSNRGIIGLRMGVWEFRERGLGGLGGSE